MTSLAIVHHLLCLLMFGRSYSGPNSIHVTMENNCQPTSSSRPPTLSDLPTEIISLIVDQVLLSGPGAERQAMALAATNRDMHQNTITTIYEHTIRNGSFHLVHWAAANNRKDVLKLALSYGADINEPFQSIDPFNSGEINFFSSRQEITFDSELDSLVCKRVKLFRRQQWRLDQKWYGGDNCAEIRTKFIKRLYKHYDDGDYCRGMRNQPMFSTVSRMIFLDMFCFWTTPLHLAIAAGHSDMIDELIRHGADVNATSYGNCDCNHSDEASSSNPMAYSCIHLLDCNGLLHQKHHLQALLRGPNLPWYIRMNRSMIAPGSQLVTPVKSAVQPHNILHEVLLSRPGMERSAWYLKALIDAGDGRMLRERDADGKLPVELAMAKGLDLEIVQTLLGGQEDLLVHAPTDGAHGNEASSVLIWAILAGHLQYANYLLPGNPARPRNSLPKCAVDPTAVTTSKFSALHAICAQASGEVQMVAFVAARDGLFPRNAIRSSCNGPENHRKTLLENILKTKAVQQIDMFSEEERTPLSEALAWVAAAPFCEIEEYVYILVQHRANPFAGIEKGLKSPIEVFLELIVSARKYHVLAPKSINDFGHIEKLLEILHGINFRVSQAQAAGVPEKLFLSLQNSTDFLWVPQALQTLRSFRG